MLVIVCGMPRSGSTLHYQMACAVVERTGMGRGLGWNWEALASTTAGSAPRRPRGVVKVHDPRPDAERTLDLDDTRFLYTYRDIRDAAVSFIDAFGHAAPHAFRARIREWVRWFDHFTAQPRVQLTRYEDFATSAEGAQREIRRIAHFLDAPLPEGVETPLAAMLDSARQRDRIAAKTGGSRWDPVTLLHHNHISDGRAGKWKDLLSGEHLSIIEEEAGEWIIRMGYDASAAVIPEHEVTRAARPAPAHEPQSRRRGTP